MNKLHVALAVAELSESVADYSRRLGAEPCCVVEGTYALWRTASINLSISVLPERAGQLRHLGFEDPTSPAMGEETDPNGIVWERFTADQQRAEILARWPNAEFG